MAEREHQAVSVGSNRHTGKLFLVYVLISYVMLWPKFLEEFGGVGIRGDFGLIQPGDAILLLFAFGFVVTLLTRRAQRALIEYKWSVLLLVLFVGYWIAKTAYMHAFGSAGHALHHLRYLAYYLFSLFLVVRISDVEDVRRMMRLVSVLVVVACALNVGFMFVWHLPFVKSMMRTNAPMFYEALYVDSRVMLTNNKAISIFFPFLLSEVLLSTSFLRSSRRLIFLSFVCACFLFVLAQARAAWLVAASAFLITNALLFHKRSMRIINMIRALGVILGGFVLILALVLVGTVLMPDLGDRISGRFGSMKIANVEKYRTSKEMSSLNSRIESYKLLLSKMDEEDVLFGKGLGSVIDKHGPFEYFVDSTYLMAYFAGGIVGLLLLLMFQLHIVWQAWIGYVRAQTDAEICFFSSSIASLLSAYALAIQDRMLYWGNTVIMFAVISAMILFMRHRVGLRGGAGLDGNG